MEGVTDNRNLLTNEITYKRMASSLGLAEQQEEFNPVQVEMVMAVLDVAQFTTNTIGLLNLATLVHSRGLNTETVLKVLRFSPPPHFEEQLWDDLLTKRNRHLLDELNARLPVSEQIIVPWGVSAHAGDCRGNPGGGLPVGRNPRIYGDPVLFPQEYGQRRQESWSGVLSSPLDQAFPAFVLFEDENLRFFGDASAFHGCLKFLWISGTGSHWQPCPIGTAGRGCSFCPGHAR